MRLLILFIVLSLSGCQVTSRESFRAHDLVGTYSNGDGFWPRFLELKKDGSFEYQQMTDVLLADGTMQGSWSISGSWTFMPLDRVRLKPSNNEVKDITVYLRRTKKGAVAVLEPDLFPKVVEDWHGDSHYGYLTNDGGPHYGY